MTEITEEYEYTTFTDEKEAARLWKEITKRENFMEKVDDRDTDPDYSQDEMNAEDEKYQKYLAEVKVLKEQLNKITVIKKRTDTIEV